MGLSGQRLKPRFVRILVTAMFFAGCIDSTPSPQRLTINGETMRVSEIAPEELYRENPQFARDANAYTPDPEAISDLKGIATQSKIVIFLGTWEPDSMSEIAKFLKVIDETGNPNFEVTVYALDRDDRNEGGNAIVHGIVLVPTIVLYRADQELGRIVEYPKTSMEADLLDILRAHTD